MNDRIISDGPRIQQWMHERSGLPLQAKFFGVARELDGAIVSAFGFDSFQDGGCAFHACTDRPFTKGLIRWAFAIPFIQWKYRFMVGIISAKNLKSLKLARKLGFTEVGCLPGELHFFALKKEDCRWIPAEKQLCQAAEKSPMLQT